MQNVHNKLIPADVLAEAQRKIDEAADILKPYLLALTPEERRTMLKMGDKTLSFVEKAYDYAVHNPSFLPHFLDISDFRIDREDILNLRTLNVSTNQLADGIDDTVMIAGSEAFQAAIIFYNSVKQAALHDIPGAKAIYEELKARFPGRRKKKEEE
ncbi:MAG: hypothetical protein LBQ64_05375 [Bacteroidales bacterium]|jgi:hypothetical protein|nr:hypothetical protein [Bacteroidales bacterium]